MSPFSLSGRDFSYEDVHDDFLTQGLSVSGIMNVPVTSTYIIQVPMISKFLANCILKLINDNLISPFGGLMVKLSSPWKIGNSEDTEMLSL